MIRTTHEAALFSLWRDVALVGALVKPQYLTTGRYEPVSRNALGSGYLDLLFERDEQSCVISGLRLDPNSLITRERSPFIWPAHVASLLDSDRLLGIEHVLTPWLRSLARARPMAQEAIRRFAASERFDRARDAELLGAAPLAQVMMRMAPFVYARRFATGSRVLIDSEDQALGHAVLADLAASIVLESDHSIDDRNGDRAFVRAWYGVYAQNVAQTNGSDIVLVDRPGIVKAPIIIDGGASRATTGVCIEMPTPAPLDLLFSFDAADAPAICCFWVRASEPALRASPPWHGPNVVGGSAGKIVIAMSPEARAMRGADVDEAQILQKCLAQEGLTATIVSEIGDHMMAGAELVHILGGAFEAHTIAFAQAARERGIDFVFDLAPRPQSPSGYLENMLVMALRAASDDAERARYLRAYEERRATGDAVREPSAEEYTQTEERFAALTTNAVAVIAAEEDVEGLRAWLPSSVADRVFTRGVLSGPEPAPAAIGHLVPTARFAFVHTSIGPRSHALFAAVAAESRGVPLVIAGPCYDVEYLQTLRTIAPSAVVMADPDAGVISAIYRRATIWIDAAPRPRSAAGLMRAVACGALPVLALESPLARIAGSGVPTFGLTSFEECEATIVAAMALNDRDERIDALQVRLTTRRDLARTFGEVMAVYARVASAV